MTGSRTIHIDHISRISPKHLEQFWGPWAIGTEYADNILNMLASMDMAEHSIDQRSPAVDYQVTTDGIAIVEVQGMMTKRGSSFSGNPGTVELRRQVSQAARDPGVKGILLSIESPGGTAAGTKEFADAVGQASQSKPVFAYIEDLGASAAYFVASQATQVWANKPAMVGSIGTFMVAIDQSKMADDLGVVVHVVKAGEFKGAGVPGTPVTESQLDYYQGLINQVNDDFLAAVQGGRRMSQDALAAVANGKVYLSTEAKTKGLIDQIGTFEVAMKELINMAETQTAPKPATLQELRSALVGADSDFLLEQLSENATLQDAQEAWICEQNDRLAVAQKAVKEAEEKAAAAASEGVEPIGEQAAKDRGRDGSARDEWNERIEKKVAGGMDRPRAVMAVNRENPGLREAMLAQVNG